MKEHDGGFKRVECVNVARRRVGDVPDGDISWSEDVGHCEGRGVVERERKGG